MGIGFSMDSQFKNPTDMTRLIIKHARLKRARIECHGEALQAFLMTKDFKYQYEKFNLSNETVYWLQMFDPIHAIEVSRNEFKFFAGWYWLPICRQLNTTNITIIVHSGIKQNQIQRAAWAYLLGNQFKSLHRRNNLVQMVDYLESMPAHIRKDLFETYKTNSAQMLIQLLSNETRSAIRNQQKYFKHEKTPSLQSSIRNQLTGGK